MAILRIFVANLPWTVGHGELRRYFQEFGRVLRSTVVFEKSTGISKGYGFVTFSDEKTWENVRNQQIHQIDGWKITLQKASRITNN